MGAILLLAAVSASAAQRQQKPVTCGSCHAKQAKIQPTTSMARALISPSEDPTLIEHQRLTFQRGKFLYRIERSGRESVYSVTDGTDTISLPISWVFGAGSQTFIVQKQNQLFETLVSYYPAIEGLDVTIGDQQIQPQTLAEAMGRRLTDHDVQSCFQCHSTGTVSKEHLHLEALTPGVQCERCHPGAAVHFQALLRGKPAFIPQKLGRLSPEDTSNFCGQCHRTWEEVVRNKLFGPINVRFQPYRLANSKCYSGSDRRLNCTTCHDPHAEVVRGATSYDPMCLACHSGPGGNAQGHQVAEGSAKICSKATSQCVRCHMPKMQLPGGHQIFTDHYIRIVAANESYPN